MSVQFDEQPHGEQLFYANISCDYETDGTAVITSISYNVDGILLSERQVRELLANIGIYVYITNVYLMPNEFIDILCDAITNTYALYFDDYLQTRTQVSLAKCKKIALAATCLKRIGFSSIDLPLVDYDENQTNIIAAIIAEHKSIKSLTISSAHLADIDAIINAMLETNMITEIFSKFYSCQLIDLLTTYKRLKTLRIDTRFSVGMFCPHVKQLISEYTGLLTLSVYYNMFINAERIKQYTDILRANKSITTCGIWGLSHAPELAVGYATTVASIPNITTFTMDIYDLDATLAILASGTLRIFEIQEQDEIDDADIVKILRALDNNYTLLQSAWLIQHCTSTNIDSDIESDSAVSDPKSVKSKSDPKSILERNFCVQDHIVASVIFNMHPIIKFDMNPLTIVEIYDAVSPHHKHVPFKTKYAIGEKLTASYRNIYAAREVKKAARWMVEHDHIN